MKHISIESIDILKLQKEQMLHAWDIYLLSSMAIISTIVDFFSYGFLLVH